MHRLGIVVPVYNEGENILAFLDAVEEAAPCPYRLYLVYDRDEDSTLPVVKPLAEASDGKINLIKNKYEPGPLTALKTGFETAEEEAVLVLMADLSDDFTIFQTMLDCFEDGADIVCGSRYMRGGRQIGGPWLKKMFSRWGGRTLHWFSGVPTHDISNSFKLYRKSVLDSLTVESCAGFEIGMELTLKAHFAGFKVVQTPATWRDRESGESNFQFWKWLPHYARWYFWAIKKRFFNGPEK